MTISFSISPSHWHFLAICFSFSPSLLFSPISLYRACSPPFTLSLTFRGTWWKSNCPTELVCLLSYQHHAILCVCLCGYVCILTNICPCAPLSLSICPVCTCQAHLAAKLNQFQLWKLPQMSTALNIKCLNSFVCPYMYESEQQRVHAGVLKITSWTWPCVCGCIRATPSAREEKHFIKSPVFTDPSGSVPPRPCSADHLTAQHNSSMGSVVSSRIVLL